MRLYADAFAALSEAASPSARSAALELQHVADVNALTAGESKGGSTSDFSVWRAHIAGSERLPLENIRAYKESKGGGDFRYAMQRVIFGSSVTVNIGLTVTMKNIEMVLDCGSGRSETVTVTLTKQPT